MNLLVVHMDFPTTKFQTQVKNIRFVHQVSSTTELCSTETLVNET